MKIVNLYYFIISIIFNLILLTGVLFSIYLGKDKIYKYYVNTRNNKIVMLGDSITLQGGKWELLLKRNDVVNSGIGGITTKNLGRLVHPLVFKFDPVICFVMVGINDIDVGVPINNIVNNYIQIIESIQKKNILPMIQSTIYVRGDNEINHKIYLLNQHLKQYTSQKKLEFVDLNQVLSENKQLKAKYAQDNAHLNKKAYSKWKVEIQKILTKYNI